MNTKLLHFVTSTTLLVTMVGLSGCVTPPEPPVRYRTAETPAVVPPTQVYVYPLHGQSEAQLDRDRYECHVWAVKQTGFDPSQRQIAPHQQVQVTPMPPNGAGTATGAVTGAVLGAAVSHPHDSAEGAIVGAIAGAVIGASSDAARQEQADRVQHVYDQRAANEAARLERGSDGYKRALGACLEGRGYTVK